MNKKIKKQIIISIIVLISFLVSTVAVLKSYAFLACTDSAENTISIGVNYPDDNP